MLIHERAELIATVAHGATGQKRRYSGEDYIVHPRAVVALLVEHAQDEHYDTLAAAWLHDVLEDTELDGRVILEFCSLDVFQAVVTLTNEPLTYGNRKERKEADNKRLASAPGWVQTVKVADLIDNTRSIVQYDPDFAKVYMREKAELLKVLTRADPALLTMARKIVDEYYTSQNYFDYI